MAKKVLKPKREDLSTFFEKVRKFDLNAQSKLDEHLEKLSARRRATIDIRKLKWRIWRSAYMACWHHHWVHRQRPQYVSEAEGFLATLDRLMSEIRGLRVNTENFAMVAESTLLPARPSHVQEESVSAETQSLLARLRVTEDDVRRYLNHHVIADDPSSNSADHFIRRFSEMTAIAWRASVAPELQRRRDRGDFVGILGVALDELGYPRSGKQIGSDNWLHARVRHYDIWK